MIYILYQYNICSSQGSIYHLCIEIQSIYAYSLCHLKSKTELSSTLEIITNSTELHAQFLVQHGIDLNTQV